MFTRSVKIIISGCILFFATVIILSIVLPLTLVKNDKHLIVAVIPGFNDGTIKALKTLNDPVYDKFFNENMITSLNDDAENLKYFTRTNNTNSNYLKFILDEENYVILTTEGDYNGRVPIDLLGQHETINFPNIIPSVFISGGLEKMKIIERSLYNNVYEDQYLDLDSIFKQEVNSFGAIMNSNMFGYKIDNPRKYDSMLEYFAQKKINMFETKGITIFDFTKSEDALVFKDGISYLTEIRFILDLFLKNKAFENKNIIFLPSLLQNNHIHIDDHFNMDMIKNVQHSFNYLLEQDRILSCDELQNIFNVEKLNNCIEDNALSVDYLYDLVEKNFGIYIIDDHNNFTIFGQGKKVSELESDVQHTFKSLGQEISRIFKYQSDKEQDEIPNDDDTKIIVKFDTNTHQFLNNPCHLSTSLENVHVGITSDIKDFGIVNLYCQRDNMREVIALFDLSFDQKISTNLKKCDNIFLRVRGDDKDQDNIIIPKAKDIKFTNDIQLGTIINFEMDDKCKDAFIVSRCESDLFDHSCENIQLPYIYTEFSNEYLHFKVIDRNNHLFYEEISLPVFPVKTISSDIRIYESGLENYVLLDNLVISPSNKSNDWETSTILRYEDDEIIDITLQYNSNDDIYILIIDEDDYFREGVYKLEIHNHIYQFEILPHIDFGEFTKTFFTNKCHLENTIIEIDIVVDKFIDDNILLMCDDELIEIWEKGNYDLTKNVNIDDCDNIYLKIERQNLDYQTNNINIKKTSIGIPDEIFLSTQMPFNIDVEECKDSFIFYECQNDECVEITTLPHMNGLLNINNNDYYSIVGSSNEYEYLTLNPIKTKVQMDLTTYIGYMNDNMLLDTLSIDPIDPNNTEGYHVKIDHVIDDIVIEVLDGLLMPSDSNSFDIKNVIRGYNLVLKDKTFENGKYIVKIGNVNIEYDVELLAFFDKNIKSTIKNTCFTLSSTFKYMVNFHEQNNLDVYLVCQKDGLDDIIEKVELPFEHIHTATDCDLIFLTPDPDAEELLVFDQIIPRSSNIIIEPVVDERLLGNSIILNIDNLSCSTKDFIFEACVIDGKCTKIDFEVDENNAFYMTHPLKHFEYIIKSEDIEHISFNFVPVETITLGNNEAFLTDNGNGIILDNFVIEPASLENEWDIEIKVEFGNTIFDAILKHNIVDETSIFKVNLKDDELFKFGKYVLIFKHGDDYKTTRISVIVNLQFDESTSLFLSNKCHILDTLDNIPMGIYNNINNGYLVCLNNENIIYTLPITKDVSTIFNLNYCDSIYLSAVDIDRKIRKSEIIILEKTSFIDIPIYDDTILFGSTVKYVEDLSQFCLDNLVLEHYKLSSNRDLIPSHYEINTGYLESNGDDFMFVIKGRKNDFEYKKLYHKSERIQYIHIDGAYSSGGDEYISPFNLIINTPLQEFYWSTPLHISRNNKKYDVMLIYDNNGYILETIGDYGFEVGYNSLIFPGNRALPFIINSHSNTYNLVICVLENQDKKTCKRDFENILEPLNYYIELQNNIVLPSHYKIKIYSISEDDDNKGDEFIQYAEQNDQLHLLPGSYYICVYDEVGSVFGNSCIDIDIVHSPVKFSDTTLDSIPDTCMIDVDEFNIPIYIDDIFKRSIYIVCTDDFDNILRQDIYDDYEDTEKIFNIGRCVKLFILLENETELENYQDVVEIKQIYLDYDDDESTMFFSRIFRVKLINTCEPETPSKILINEKETDYYQIRTFSSIPINIQAVVGEYSVISKTHSTLRITGISYTDRFQQVCANGLIIRGTGFEVKQGNDLLNLPNEISNIEGMCTRDGFHSYSAILSISPNGHFNLMSVDQSMTNVFKFKSETSGIDITIDVVAPQYGDYCRRD